MTIINLMLGVQRGGLEQAAIDYAEALKLAGQDCLSIVAPGSWAQQTMQPANLPHHTLKQRSGHDLPAAWRLRRMVRAAGGKAIICHGNGALSLALPLRAAPVIAVAHNYQTKRFRRADACFAITQHGLDALAHAGIPRQRLHFMPNMVRLAQAPTRHAMRQPPVIGSMGRFVPKKGYALLIDALAMLRANGVTFSAVIGGGGDDENALRAQIAHHHLQDTVTLPGWVENKAQFFAAMDVFVLPSHHEPFGIVLIEAMAAGVPVISTATEGPREILPSPALGMLTPVGDAAALAAALQQALADAPATAAMGEAGRAHVAALYSPQSMAGRLNAALATIITGN